MVYLIQTASIALANSSQSLGLSKWIGIIGTVVTAFAACAIVFLTVVSSRRARGFQRWTMEQRSPSLVFIRGVSRTTESDKRIGGVFQVTLQNPGDVPIFLQSGCVMPGWKKTPEAHHLVGQGLFVLKTPQGEHEEYHQIPRLEARDILINVSFSRANDEFLANESKVRLILQYISGSRVRRRTLKLYWNRGAEMLVLPSAWNAGADQLQDKDSI